MSLVLLITSVLSRLRGTYKVEMTWIRITKTVVDEDDISSQSAVEL